MNIMLTGASGFIGRNIAAALVAGGHRLRTVTRGDGIDFRHMLRPEDWLPLLDGTDAVINSVGIIGETGHQRFETLHAQSPIALFTACAQAGVRRVVQISALGADQTAFSAYHLSKRSADDALRSLNLDWFVLRPSLVYGSGGGSAELFMRLATLPLIPVIDDGAQVLQPVHIRDVVAAVVHALQSDSPRQTVDIVGDETVSFAEWLQRMRQACGLPRGRLLHVPYRLVLALSQLARYFEPIAQPENLRMLARGYRSESGPLTRFLGRPPLPFAPALFFTSGLAEPFRTKETS